MNVKCIFLGPKPASMRRVSRQKIDIVNFLSHFPNIQDNGGHLVFCPSWYFCSSGFWNKAKSWKPQKPLLIAFQASEWTKNLQKHSKKILKCISKPNFANQTQMIAISLSKLLYKCLIGSGGGTSGRAMPFCLSRPGSNPLNDGFSFFVQNWCQFILTGRWAFSTNV